jgi:hypothetical protein
MSVRSIFALAAITVLGASCLMAAEASAYDRRVNLQRNPGMYPPSARHFGVSYSVCTGPTPVTDRNGNIVGYRPRARPICQQRSGVYH